jgi:hypothetical protein
MIAKITTIIDKQDTCEIIRDQIAAILAIEITNQEVLAIAVGKNPADFLFSVFSDCSNPWESEEMPLVNVHFNNDRFDNKNSNMIDRQRATGTFYIDCYANKKTTDADSGDELSSKDADRIARLVRNILMAQEYTYLALGYRELGNGNNLVTRRYITKREKIGIDIRQEGYENIVACRITLEVDYDELSPQVVMENLETLILSCTQEDSGKVNFNAEYNLKEE